jgi:oligo-1,6-glucosidase/glucan 1,6-alpha-glucosidase
MDVIELIGKNIDKGILGNTEKTHEYIKEMHERTFGRFDSFTVGETGGANIERAKLYSNPDRKELDMVFQFQHIGLDEQRGKSKWDLKKLDLIELKDVLSSWQTDLGDQGWNSLYWNNHDQPRIVSRWGNDKEYRVESAKMLATILHFMKGTPYIYQGEEIGMTNAYFEDIKQYKDIETLNLYKERIEAGYSHEEIMNSILTKGRDNARTPMQWSEEANAGFTQGTPWIEVNKNFRDINTRKALVDKNSIFNYYKRLVELRKNNPLIVHGDYKLILRENPNIYSYIREYNNERLLVICNFYETEAAFELPKDIKYADKELVISNYEKSEHNLEAFTLRSYEACVYKLV